MYQFCWLSEAQHWKHHCAPLNCLGNPVSIVHWFDHKDALGTLWSIENQGFLSLIFFSAFPWALLRYYTFILPYKCQNYSVQREKETPSTLETLNEMAINDLPLKRLIFMCYIFLFYIQPKEYGCWICSISSYIGHCCLWEIEHSTLSISKNRVTVIS